jgi:hypothetical protein
MGGGGLAQSGLQMVLSMLAGQMGTVPMGMSGSLMNNMRAQNFTFTHDQVANWAYANDFSTGPGRNIAEAAAHAVGLDPNSEEFKNQFGSAANWARPLVVGAMNNDWGVGWVDTLAGGRSQMAFSHHLHMAGRNWTDPTTGVRGLGTDATTALSNALYGPSGFGFAQDGWRERTRGLSASQMGGAVRDLSLRGIIGENDFSLNEDGTIDAERMKGTLEKYTKEVSAMNEIFGANGITNAPFKRLREAIETFTGGANYHLDSGRTEMMIRNTYAAAENAGVGMQGLFTILQQGNTLGQQLGLASPGFWSNAAAQDSLSYAASLRSAGFMKQPAWGAMSPDQLIAARQSLDIANAASPAGNILGMLSRMDRSGELKAGSAAHGLFTAARDGTLTGTDLDTLLDAPRMMSLMESGSTLNMGQLLDMQQQTARNEWGLSLHEGFGGSLRQAAHRESYEVARRAARTSITANVRAAGVGGGKGVSDLTTALEQEADTLYKSIVAEGDAGITRASNHEALATDVARSFVNKARELGTAESRKMLDHWRSVGKSMGLEGDRAIFAGARADALRYTGAMDTQFRDKFGYGAEDWFRQQAKVEEEAARAKSDAKMAALMSGKGVEQDTLNRFFAGAQTFKYDREGGMASLVTHMLKEYGGIADLSVKDGRVGELADLLEAQGKQRLGIEEDFKKKQAALDKRYATGDMTKEEYNEAYKAMADAKAAKLKTLSRNDKTFRESLTRDFFGGDEEKTDEFLRNVDKAQSEARNATFSGNLAMTIKQLIINAAKDGSADAEGKTDEDAPDDVEGPTGGGK